MSSDTYVIWVTQTRNVYFRIYCPTCEVMRDFFSEINNLPMSYRPEGKRPLRRSGRRWEDNIKIHYKRIIWEGVRWIWFGSGQNHVAGCRKRGTEILGSIEQGEL